MKGLAMEIKENESLSQSADVAYTQLQNRSFHVVDNESEMSKNEKCTCKACKTSVFQCQIYKFVTFLSSSSLKSSLTHDLKSPMSQGIDQESEYFAKPIDATKAISSVPSRNVGVGWLPSLPLCPPPLLHHLYYKFACTTFNKVNIYNLT